MGHGGSDVAELRREILVDKDQAHRAAFLREAAAGVGFSLQPLLQSITPYGVKLKPLPAAVARPCWA